MPIHLRRITTIPELTEVAKLEQEVWGMSPIPVHQTLTAIKNGGIMLGGYDGEQLVGFAYGFAGRKDGKTYLCSHMMGIRQEYRGQGIGYRLKLMQRELAMEEGYKRITWTYDPLETRNGYLNLHKLRAQCRGFVVDCYGGMNDRFNDGLPTDRLVVDWNIDEVNQPAFMNVAYTDIDTSFIRSLFHEWSKIIPLGPVRCHEVRSGPHLIIPVPLNFQDLKARDIHVAYDWRISTRNAFLKGFSEGYSAVDVVIGSTVAGYILASCV